MHRATKPLVGVLGGMGPEATMHFAREVISLTDTKADQGHVHMLIDNNPSVPDRTSHLTAAGPSPLPALIEMARKLECSGADLLVMPCNTAHAYYPALKAHVSVPFLNMVTITANTVLNKISTQQKVGLLASQGTLHAGIYQQAWRHSGRPTLLLPEPKQQVAVQVAIEKVKAGDIERATKAISPVLRSLERRGASVFLLGCTEIPLITDFAFPELNVVSSTTCLARETVALVGRLERAGEVKLGQCTDEAEPKPP